jgi:hypothetical protein
VYPYCKLETLTPEAVSNPKVVGSLETRDVHPHCKLETLTPEDMCNIDMAMDFVNDEDWVITRHNTFFLQETPHGRDQLGRLKMI